VCHGTLCAVAPCALTHLFRPFEVGGSDRCLMSKSFISNGMKSIAKVRGAAVVGVKMVARILIFRSHTSHERRRLGPARRARNLHLAAFPSAWWCVPRRVARRSVSSRCRVVVERGRVMDRCSRWVYSGDALEYELTASSGPPKIDGVGPHVPRIWETCPVCGRLRQESRWFRNRDRRPARLHRRR